MTILIFNPALVRLTALGACEQDRLAHAARLIARGCAVRVLTGYMPYQQRDDVTAFYAARSLPVDLFPVGTQSRHPARLTGLVTDLALADGMAWEYAAPLAAAALRTALAADRPAAVWCHGSYTWPAAQIARRMGIPVVIRSVNYEPAQMQHERVIAPITNGLRRYIGDGLNAVRVAAKVHGERHAVRTGVIAAISPAEQALYKSMIPGGSLAVADHGMERVLLLPLQTLPALLRPPRPARPAEPLHAFFMGASYNVQHNRAALDFLVHQVIPRVRVRLPGRYVFHLLGSKLPAGVTGLAAPDLIFPGYVPDLEAYLAGMDIALAPSLGGAGMQQKVFEPLARAFPTLTHQRGLAGYPFVHAVHVLDADRLAGGVLDAATSANGFVTGLERLTDPALRTRLSAAAAQQSAALFSQPALDAIVDAALATR